MMRTESNMTKARRIVEENEVKLGACMLKPERERFIENAARLLEPRALAFFKAFADAIGPMLNETITGYIVEARPGLYLNRSLFWFPYDRPEDAWVHSGPILTQIIAYGWEWETQPARIHPATYSKATGVVVTGEPIPFAAATLDTLCPATWGDTES